VLTGNKRSHFNLKEIEPIIPVMKEAEMGGSRFEASPGKTVRETLFQRNKLGMVVHNCNHRYKGSGGRRIPVRGWLAQTKVQDTV
jgi:hypothetical protein